MSVTSATKRWNARGSSSAIEEMADMETVEMEAHKEFAKMKRHVELYMSEMEQCI